MDLACELAAGLGLGAFLNGKVDVGATLANDPPSQLIVVRETLKDRVGLAGKAEDVPAAFTWISRR